MICCDGAGEEPRKNKSVPNKTGMGESCNEVANEVYEGAVEVGGDEVVTEWSVSGFLSSLGTGEYVNSQVSGHPLLRLEEPGVREADPGEGAVEDADKSWIGRNGCLARTE